MGFSFQHAFVIKAPPDKVFAYLVDPYRVAPALPGASLGEKGDDGSYSGTITIKVGPVTARYRGKMRFDSVDPVAHTVSMVASGQDTSGRGGADMRMQSRLVEKAPGETEVSVSSEVSVTGILAQFGRGMIQDVSTQIFQKFAQSVCAELERPDATPPAPVPPPPVAAAPAVSPPPAPAPPVPAPAPAVVPDTVASAPIDLVSVGGKALGRATLRALTRPALWIFVFVVILVVYWFMHRS
jgi:carbon monoxide dehydrogenase subunit G